MTSEMKKPFASLAEEVQSALDYSRNFATAKPNIGSTEKEHILGLCNLLERLHAVQQQDAPVAVPDGYRLLPVKITRPMIEAALEAHYGKRRVQQVGGAAGVDMTANGINYNGIQALRRMWAGALSTAQTPPAQPMAVPAVRALLLALERAHAGHMVGHDQSDQPKGGYSDGYVNGYGACIESVRRLLAAAQTPPAQQSQWVPDECPHVIWFDDADREPILFAGAGAREAAIKAWEQISRQWNAHLFVRVQRNSRDDRYPCAKFAAPCDTAAPEQAGYRIGYRDGATVFASYLLDNCERETVYEESLQRWLDHMLRTHPAPSDTAAPEQAEQPECGCCGKTGPCDLDCDAVESVPRELLSRIARPGGVDTLLAIDELRALLGGDA